MEERRIVARYHMYHDKIHNGSLYTVLGKKHGMEDPFNDVSKYSARYKRQKRRVSKLDSRPYVKEFFLEELWDTLGIDGDSDAEDGRGKEKGKVKSGKGKKGVLQRLLGEGVGDDDDDGDDEVTEEEEEAEDYFGDDEEGDYNAEMYFNDGEDDGGDDWGDGGGGEDYY
ncbi:DNA-directed RNA polymerase III, subunit Rpc31 [Tuber indicum]|nr:DNA-directed RNA polymerase III, subunit Rpc31 [Tuber indicum]